MFHLLYSANSIVNENDQAYVPSLKFFSFFQCVEMIKKAKNKRRNERLQKHSQNERYNFVCFLHL